MDKLDERDYWRAIILYGLNTATYKIALGLCLATLVDQGKTRVSMNELAEEFFGLYLERLQSSKPQLLLPNRLTVMERIVQRFRSGQLTREQAIGLVERDAFGDVIPRFHVVNNQMVPYAFYEHGDSGLILTDNVFNVLSTDQEAGLIDELWSRWDLLEAAFTMRREDFRLGNDIRSVFLERGYERTSVTHLIPVLNGYQNGVCFYCGELMQDNDIHVDHVIPRQLIFHDEIWNLVLAHSFCNTQKSDALPSRTYIEKLIVRNEYFIASNHPIKDRLIQEIGRTPQDRSTGIWSTYDEARAVIRYEWGGVRGYNPATDPFYRTLVRSFGK